MGKIHVDAVRREEAMRAIVRLVEGNVGGYVFTPNVDHVVMAEDSPDLASAYRGARLSLADGMPIVWASRLLGHPVPERLAGSDMLAPIAGLAAAAGWSVYLVGGRNGAVKKAADALCEMYPRLRIVGADSPYLSLAPGHVATREAVERIRRAGPQLLFMGLSGPKQELLLHRTAERLNPTLAFGVGAAIDMMAGLVPRAPRWMSGMGLEWLYRLSLEPKRLWRRYLIRDPRFVGVVWRMLFEPRDERMRLQPLLPARHAI